MIKTTLGCLTTIKMNGAKSCMVSLLLEDFSKKYDPKGFRNSLQKVRGERK